MEPIQGEAGVIVPPDGYLRAARELCTERGVLLMADEIQSGLGRTGTTFAVEHEGVVPDVYVLGKALGGGIMPLSAVVADRDVLGVFKPGEHGSTFGGNPLACAIGIEVIDMLRDGTYQRASAELGAWLRQALRDAGDSAGGRGPRPRASGSGSTSSPARERARGVRTSDGARDPREGHARVDDPPGAAARGEPRGPRVGARADPRRAPHRRRLSQRGYQRSIRGSPAALSASLISAQ